MIPSNSSIHPGCMEWKLGDVKSLTAAAESSHTKMKPESTSSNRWLQKLEGGKKTQILIFENNLFRQFTQS